MRNTVVICAFMACGKSYARELFRGKYSIADSDSSLFSWIKKNEKNTGVRNKEFPRNYIRHIKSLIGEVDVILVSSHTELREALHREGIEFIMVVPERGMLNEWIGRCYRRGSGVGFIDVMIKNWDNWLGEIEREKYYKDLYVLGHNQFLSDLIPIILNKRK